MTTLAERSVQHKVHMALRAITSAVLWIYCLPTIHSAWLDTRAFYGGGVNYFKTLKDFVLDILGSGVDMLVNEVLSAWHLISTYMQSAMNNVIAVCLVPLDDWYRTRYDIPCLTIVTGAWANEFWISCNFGIRYIFLNLSELAYEKTRFTPEW